MPRKVSGDPRGVTPPLTVLLAPVPACSQNAIEVLSDMSMLESEVKS
jgi:hypothetical protein